MRRLLAGPALVVCVLLAGCVGDTDPASHLRATRAQLNAHGHTDNGPARWWWEYGVSRSTVAGGGGTKTPKQGPASSAGDVNLRWVVGSLQPDQPYYFRACGQDTAAGSPVRCGQVRRFRTSPADSTIGIARPAGGPVHLNYVAAPTVRHDVLIEAPNRVVETLEDATGQDPPLLGATLAAGTLGCQVAQDARGYLADGTCSDPAGLDRHITATMGPFADRVRLPFGGVVHFGAGDDTLEGDFGDLPVEAYGEAGDDTLRGGDGPDFIHGGEGNDFVASGFGGDGRDVLDGGPGADFYFCDAGDIVLVDRATEFAQAQALGCTPMFNAAAARAAARKAQAR